jgi:fumarylpyruvate hydrolase
MNIATPQNHVIQAPAPVSLPVRGTQSRFPVHRIYCVGRNYAAHTIEMGGDPNREPPFFFQKNPDNVVLDGADFPYPPRSERRSSRDRDGRGPRQGRQGHPARERARPRLRLCVGLDMTRRDLQGEAKKRPPLGSRQGLRSLRTRCGEIVPASRDRPSRRTGAIWLDVNGVRQQTGDLNHMIWKVPEMISYLSGLFELQPGDLIMSGTPAGVGAVKRGDTMVGGVYGVGTITIKVG